MNNKIINIQNIIFNQIERLDNDNSKEEIARANAISNASASFIKSVNLQLAVISAAAKLSKKPKALEKELGICVEE